MMPLHRRVVATGGERVEESSPESTGLISGAGKKKESQPKSSSNVLYLFTFIVFVEVAIQWVGLRHVRKIMSTTHLMWLMIALAIFSSPLLLIAVAVFDQRIAFPHQKYIPLATAATILGNNFPNLLTTAVVCFGLVAFGLASRPLSKNHRSHASPASGWFATDGPVPTVLAAVLMISVLLTENFFIWVVSATYKQSQTRSGPLPEPLQDNGKLVAEYFFEKIIRLSKREVVAVRNTVNVQWALVTGLGLSFVFVELTGRKIGRNLWKMGLRGLLTLTIARAIRTVSFLVTVLPSQNQRCYFEHFPSPPPEDWQSWILQGMLPQANGGCNDLIISGHATVTATIACIVTSVVGRPIFTTSIWMLVAFDYLVEVYEGFHYTVDMWLGCLLVNLIWANLRGVEVLDTRVHSEQATAREFLPLNQYQSFELVAYAIPAMGAFLQVSGVLPRGLSNYTILSYVGFTVFRLWRNGFEHYVQHVLFCLLYLALGVYL